MSSALCVFIHASETSHAEGVPIAPSRGRSVEVPFGRELISSSCQGNIFFHLIKLNSIKKTKLAIIIIIIIKLQ